MVIDWLVNSTDKVNGITQVLVRDNDDMSLLDLSIQLVFVSKTDFYFQYVI